jgi:RNA polymerase sigma-70 factor (ECF subfamily)
LALDKQTKTTILVKGALKGSQKAFSDLMELYWEDIVKTLKFKNAPDNVIEDIALVSFTKAFDKLDSYKSEFAFKTWLSTIATNTLLDYFRKQKNTTISIDEVFTDESGNEFRMDFKSKTLSPEEELIASQEDTEVKKFIDKLPDNYSEIMKLRYIEHCSYKEISELVKIPVNNVKIRLLRGRNLLVSTIEHDSDLRN